MVEGGGGGEKRKQGFLLPPPPASFLFLCSRPNVLDELARKRLLHRLNLNLMVVLSIACKTSKSLICMIQCRECKNIPDTPAKYIHWYVSFQARLDTGVIPGVFSVRKSCYLKSTPVPRQWKFVYVRPLTVACDISHVSVNVCGLIVIQLTSSKMTARWVMILLFFAPVVSRLENVLYLFTLSRYTVSFVATIVDSLILTMSPCWILCSGELCTINAYGLTFWDVCNY